MDVCKLSIIMIGDGDVGKTEILKAYEGKDKIASHMKTLGVDFVVRDLTVGNNKIKVKVWDTAG